MAVLIEAPFAGADLPNALQQFVEVVSAKAFAKFEPFVVQHKAFDDVFAQGLRGPDAELGGLVAIDAVANGDNGVEVVEIDLVVFAIFGSMCKNCTY